MSLYDELAKAYAQPSRAFRDVSAALQIPDQGLAGYKSGLEYADALQKRRQDKQTLQEVLGGTVAGLSPELQNLPFGRVKEVGSALGDLSKFGKTNDLAQRQQFAIEQQARQQKAAAERQQRQQDFIRSMVGAKGNKEAVNQAKNASQGLGYLEDLWNEMDKLSAAGKSAAGTPILEKLYPTVNALKKNVLRTAGFAEGGKNFTGIEKGIIVDSFLPTTYETEASKALKKRIGREYFLGTIDLYDAARLLGPAGDKLIPIARAAEERANKERKNTALSLGGGMSGGSDLDSLYSSVMSEDEQ